MFSEFTILLPLVHLDSLNESLSILIKLNLSIHASWFIYALVISTGGRNLEVKIPHFARNDSR